MIHVVLSHRPVYEEKAQAFAVMFEQDTVAEHPFLSELQKFYKPLTTLIEERSFTAKSGTSLIVMGDNAGKPAVIMLFGLGKLNEMPVHERLERYRRSVGQLVRAADQYRVTTVALQMPDIRLFDVDAYTLAQETVTTAEMTDYHFDRFITDKPEHKEITLMLCVPEFAMEAAVAGVERGKRIGHAVNQARQWCDLPGNYINPTVLADHAERIAKNHDLAITVFDKKQIVDKGMGGIEAVSKGSVQEPRLVILEYRTEHADAPTIALVGKGVTFDSGGLSLKPAQAMETMKDDMAGAAVVISTMEAIAHIKPHVNVVALAPLVENMPSGTATRPGDIITFYNGKTAEVKNTDAEGRLILADALAYATKHYKPDIMVDLATLTGACAYALGHFFAGLMSKDDDLVEKIQEASYRSGDRVWRLPLHDDYKIAIRSDVADICNIGNERYKAGAVTAAFFLYNFVGNTPWAHLDIAGTAFNVPDMSYYRPGSTGFGVRLLVDLITNWPVCH